MYREFLRRSKRMTAIALAGAMIFGSMTVFAEDVYKRQLLSLTEAALYTREKSKH